MAAQRPAVAAEQADEGLTDLRRAERLLGEQRELPAVERLAELAVRVCQRQAFPQFGSQPGAHLVEAGRLPARPRRRDRQQGRDAQRPEIEPFEDDRAGRDCAGRREAQGRDRVGELGCGIRRLRLVGLQVALQLQQEHPVGVPPEFGRHQSLRLGPELRDLACNNRAERDAAAELGVVPAESPITGASATYVRALPNNVRSRSA